MHKKKNTSESFLRELSILKRADTRFFWVTLLWGFNWPFAGVSDLQLSDQKVTWKKLADSSFRINYAVSICVMSPGFCCHNLLQGKYNIIYVFKHLHPYRTIPKSDPRNKRTPKKPDLKTPWKIRGVPPKKTNPNPVTPPKTRNIPWKMMLGIERL